MASVDFVGEPLGAAHPSLEGRTDLVFEDLAPAAAADGMDVVLLGLPHKVTAQKVPEIAALPSVKVVDMSGDFRLQDAAAYERYYGQQHPHPELLPGFVYGLPELNRERIRDGPLRRLARLLRHHHRALAPAAGPGRAPRGRGPRPGHHRQLRLGRGPAGRHPPPGPGRQPAAPTSRSGTSTSRRSWRRWPRPGARDLQLRFVPVSAPLVRGILATAFVELPEEWTEERLAALYRDAFAGEPFVRVPARRLPEVAAVSGSNFAEVGVVAGPAWRGRRTVTVFSAIDNLVKGGAGQADPEHEPDARARRAGLARGPRTVAPMRTT